VGYDKYNRLGPIGNAMRIPKFLHINKPPTRVGSLFGIPIEVSSWWNLLIIAIFLYGTCTGGILTGLLFVGCALTVYFFVIVHEFGHALTAKKYGCQRLIIYLYPLGGLASSTLNERDVLINRPSRDFWIVFNGPLTNVIWCVLFSPSILCGIGGWYFQFCLMVNLCLFIFNMMPVFPLDGGQLLRSVLQSVFHVPFVKAAKITYYAGLIIGIPVAVLAFFAGLWTIAILLAIFAISYGRNALKQAEQIAEYRAHHAYGGFRGQQPEQFPQEVQDLVREGAEAQRRIEELLRRTR